MADTGTTDCAPASPTASSPHRPAPPAPPAAPARPAPTALPALPAPGAGWPRRHRAQAPQLAVAFASVKLTARAARPTTLRIVLTDGAVVQVRVARGRTVVVARRLSYRAGGRKRLPLGLLTAGTYTVTVTATNGAAQATDHATLRVLPGR